TGREPRVFEGAPGRFEGALALSRDGRGFARGTRFDPGGREGRSINIWVGWKGEPIQSLGGPDGYPKEEDDLSLLRKDKGFVAGSQDTTIKLWDLETGHVLHTFEGHTAFVSGAAFAPDGRRIASASYDNRVRIWDVKPGEPLFTSPKLSGVPMGVAFSAGD